MSLLTALADTLEDGGWRAKARPRELPPEGDWNGWLLMAGRGLLVDAPSIVPESMD